MINKDNTLLEEKNKVVTPDPTHEALKYLPHNFVVLTSKVLFNWKEQGKIDKTYSKVYISRVKTGDKGAFNEDIMNALVEVGTKNKKLQEKFGRITKKTSPSN
jgi:hypothetical protein